METHASTRFSCLLDQSLVLPNPAPVLQLWRDTIDLAGVRPTDASGTRDWSPTRPAYCASNLLVDDKYVYAVVGRRPQLTGDSVVEADPAESQCPLASTASSTSFIVSDSEPLRELAPLDYVLYARAVTDGRVLWSQPLGQAGSYAGSTGGGVPLPINGTAGDYWSVLQPFDLAPAPGRRIMMKYDSTVLTSSPFDGTAARVGHRGFTYIAEPAHAAEGAAGVRGLLPSVPIVLHSIHCNTQRRFDYDWGFLCAGLAASILIFRACAGCAWATVSVKHYDIRALKEQALRDAAERALLQGLSSGAGKHYQASSPSKERRRKGGNATNSTSGYSHASSGSRSSGSGSRRRSRGWSGASASSGTRGTDTNGTNSRRSSIAPGALTPASLQSRQSRASSSHSLALSVPSIQSGVSKGSKGSGESGASGTGTGTGSAADGGGARIASTLGPDGQLGGLIVGSRGSSGSSSSGISPRPQPQSSSTTSRSVSTGSRSPRDLLSQSGISRPRAMTGQSGTTYASGSISVAGIRAVMPTGHHHHHASGAAAPAPEPGSIAGDSPRGTNSGSRRHRNHQLQRSYSYSYATRGSADGRQQQLRSDGAAQQQQQRARFALTAGSPGSTSGNPKYDGDRGLFMDDDEHAGRSIIHGDVDTSSVDPSAEDDLDALCTLAALRGSAEAALTSKTKPTKRVDAAGLPISPATSPIAKLTSSLTFTRTGSPWIFLTLLHFIILISALYTSVQASTTAISNLQAALADPIRFYSNFLINRSPAATSRCRSQAAAACYCNSGSGVEGAYGARAAHSVSSLRSSSYHTAGLLAASSPPQCDTSTASTCDFDLSACAGSCSSVLEETGNCAASVFQYSCGCASDCANTQLFLNTSLAIANSATSTTSGLQQGLMMCSAHYSTLSWVLWGALGCYITFALIAVWMHLRLYDVVSAGCKRCYSATVEAASPSSPLRAKGRGKSSRRSRESRQQASPLAAAGGNGRGSEPDEVDGNDNAFAKSVRRGLRELSGMDFQSPVKRRPDAAPLLPNDFDGGSGHDASSKRAFSPQPIHAASAAAASSSSVGNGNDDPSAVFALISSPSAVEKAAIAHRKRSSDDAGMHRQQQAAASSNRDDDDDDDEAAAPPPFMRSGGLPRKAPSLKRVPSATSSTGSSIVPHIFYVVCCQIVVLAGSLLWTYFLVLQGRYCTGIDGEMTGKGTPFVGDSVTPTSSLILRYARGCAFGSSWQDNDFEGAILRNVYWCMLAQSIAVCLIFVDQGLHLAQACLYRCNAVARRQQSSHLISNTGSSIKSPFGAIDGTSGVNLLQALKSVLGSIFFCRDPDDGAPRARFDSTRVFVPEAWSKGWRMRRIHLCRRELPLRPAGADGRQEDDGVHGNGLSDGGRADRDDGTGNQGQGHVHSSAGSGGAASQPSRFAQLMASISGSSIGMKGYSGMAATDKPADSRYGGFGNRDAGGSGAAAALLGADKSSSHPHDHYHDHIHGADRQQGVTVVPTAAATEETAVALFFATPCLQISMGVPSATPSLQSGDGSSML